MRVRRGWMASGLAVALMAAAALGAAVCARRSEPGERVIAAYATSLAGRSPGQVANAVSAAHALDGAVLPPGGEFSFNHRVGPWTADRGYRRAPVSYDGELTLATGGGVCQVSTTLYGAVLLGGMDIVERHRHFWPASYARPGLDAAVAFPSIDLRFRNPLDAPVRVRARRTGSQLIIELHSTAAADTCSIETERIAIHPPARIVKVDERLSPGQVVRSNRGQPGYDVEVYRVRRLAGGRQARTLISVDSYPTLNTVVKVSPR